jgi:hypothetical protein
VGRVFLQGCIQIGICNRCGVHGELGFFVMIMRGGGGCFCCSFCL